MGTIRALILEDDFATCLLLDHFLCGLEGLEVCGTAHDGVGGLELLDREKPDLLLLDMVMPRLDGLGVLRALAQSPPKHPLKVIVVSGVSSDPLVQAALRLGADYYLLKPVDFSRLAEQIRFFFPAEQATNAREAQALWRLQQMRAPKCRGLELACTVAAALADGGRETLLKEAYYQATKRYGDSYDCVEKNIRFLITKLHREQSKTYLELVDGCGDRAPSNGAFLRKLAQCLL